MTEKIVRRGVKTPSSYEPDMLEKISVTQVIKENGLVLDADNTIGEIREWLEDEPGFKSNFYIVASSENGFSGIISASNLMSTHHDTEARIASLIKRNNLSIPADYSLRKAVELMAKENVDVLPVVSKDNRGTIIGIISYKDIIAAYKHNTNEHEQHHPSISLKRRGLKMLVVGKRRFGG